jgi:hypothetical protein
VRSLRRKLDDSELKRKTIQDKMLTMQEEWEQRMSELSHSMMQKQSSKIKGLEVRVQELQEMLVEAELAKEGLVEEKEELSEKLLEAVNKFEEMDDENENGILRKQLDSLLKEKTSLSSENNLLKDLILKQEKKDDEERELRSEKKPTKSNRKPTEQESSNQLLPIKSEYTSSKHHEPAKQLNEEENNELKQKALAYFAKKAPEVQVVCLGKGSAF